MTVDRSDEISQHEVGDLQRDLAVGLPNVWKLGLRRDATTWAVTTQVDGQQRIVSHHATREAALLAIGTLNDSGTVAASRDATS
jgi:hypothetical protein